MTSRGSDDGTAVVEFVVLALVLTVPVAFAAGGVLCITDARTTARSAAASAALVVARYGGGSARADSVVRSYWPGASDVSSQLHCSAWCGQPGGTVTVTVSVGVEVPLLPRTVLVTQEQTQVVDRFGAR